MTELIETKVALLNSKETVEFRHDDNVNTLTKDISDSEFFQQSIQLLSQYKWIYDFKVNELFSNLVFEEKFPIEWQTFLCKLDHKQLSEIVLTKDLTNKEMPVSLKYFLKRCKNLESFSSVNVSSLNQTNISKHSIKGLTFKKNYELNHLMPFVKELCEKHNCKYLIDVGSGLNHFDEFLIRNIDVKVIGCEKNEKFVSEANLRLKQNKIENIKNICVTLDENNLDEFICSVRETIIKMENKVNEKYDNIGIISLHSCGDLTPTMLKLYNQKRNDINLKFMVAFSCCYHLMRQLDEDDVNSDYYNFPLSKCLKNCIENNFTHFNLNKFAMRLACQQNLSIWRSKTKEDCLEHSKQVAYRALIEKYCIDNKIKFVKLKRKLAGKDQFSDFQTYLKYLDNRCVLESHDKATTIKVSSLNDELISYHNKYQQFFDKIEPLNALQSIMQPFIEQLILKDRETFLNEYITSAKLIRLFDDSISSRSICILAE